MKVNSIMQTPLLLTFSLAIVLILVALTAPAASAATASVPSFRSTSQYKSLSSYVQTLKSRAAAKTPTTAAQKTSYRSAVAKRFAAARPIPTQLADKRRAPLWNANRATLKRQAAGAEVRRAAAVNTIEVTYKNTVVKMRQDFNSARRGIVDTFSSDLGPIKVKIIRARAVLRLKIKPGSSKASRARLVRAKARARQIIFWNAPRLKNIGNRQNALIIEERRSFRSDVSVLRTETDTDVAAVNTASRAEVGAIDTELRRRFKEVDNARLVRQRDSDIRSIDLLRENGYKAIVQMVAKTA